MIEPTFMQEWESQYRECNWAVATGNESGLLALRFSLDTGLASMRDFGQRDPDISHSLRVRGPNELLIFLEWPEVGLPIFTCGSLAPGTRLHGEATYVRIPGPRMHVDPRYEYVDREAPTLPASEWLMDLIHANSSGHTTASVIEFRTFPNTALRVLLSFARRGDRWFCDFYESSGNAKVRGTLSYRSGDKVVSIAIRGGAFLDGNNRSRLYQGIETGHGSILLNLTSEQYNKLIAA